MYFCTAKFRHSLRNIIFALLLFLFTAPNVFPQSEPVFQFADKSFFIFRYGRNEAPDMINYFVREQSRINYLNPYRTSYSFEYEIEIKVHALDGNRLEVISIFQPKKLYGDISYKLFDLTDVLMPTVYGFSLNISLQEQNILTFEPAMLAAGDTSVTILQLSEAYDFKQTIFTAGAIHFSYDEKAISTFNHRINEIHDYLAHLELIRFSLDKAGMIDPEEKTELLTNHLQIYELELCQNYLQERSLKTDLAIPDEYNAEYQKGMSELNSSLRRLRTILSNRINLENYIFDDAAYSGAANKLITIQSGYLDAMKTTNHFFEPVYQHLAGFFKEPDDWHNLVSATVKTFEAVDAEIFRQRFGEKLWQTYLVVSEDFFRADKFIEALLMLTSAGVICNSNPEIDCGLQVFHNSSKAKFGIYDSYLQIAESAMGVQNFDLARRYLNLALAYQQKNSGLIIIPAAVNKLFEQLAWQYFESGRNAVREKNWEKAYAQLTASGEIYQMLKLDEFDDAIQKELSKIEN